jgi:hypothetical protein
VPDIFCFAFRFPELAIPRKPRKHPNLRDLPGYSFGNRSVIGARHFPLIPRQRPVLSECGINQPINRSFAPSRPINRRLAPSRLMSRAFPSVSNQCEALSAYFPELAIPRKTRKHPSLRDLPGYSFGNQSVIGARHFPLTPRQRPVLSECGINHPINRSFAPIRPINRSLIRARHFLLSFGNQSVISNR